MLSISHSLTGAFIASKLPHPALYIPLVLASHYLEDWIPHWDVGTGLSSGKRKRTTAIALEIIELGISLAVVYWFWKTNSAGPNWHIWFGAFWGLVPDFCEAPRNFLKWEPRWLRWINNFHARFHHSTPVIWFGLAPQVVLWIVVFWLK